MKDWSEEIAALQGFLEERGLSLYVEDERLILTEEERTPLELSLDYGDEVSLGGGNRVYRTFYGPDIATDERRELHIQLHKAKERDDLEEAGRIEAVIVDLDAGGLVAKDVICLAEKFMPEWMREVTGGR
jgi:hypothetical protein